ncbi:unnamed protein product [Calypogeia fissa]
MPGVLIDDQSFQLDAINPSTFFEAYHVLSPGAISHPQTISQAHQLMRHNSFSGVKDTSSNGLSVCAPVYHRSQSAISSSALFNYFGSPPTTPKKSSEPSYNSASLDIGDDFSGMVESEGSGALGGTSASAAAIAMAGGNSTSGADPRGFTNSPIVGSPTMSDSVSAFHKYLPSNNEDEESWASTVDVYACDQFRMFEFKVRRCMRGRSHDWTECPFAHPGEKARRRDPRRFHYSGTACPDFRKGSCRRGDACEFAHGVFECWLHPARYRTQPCKDGRNCRRRVCFFAHTPEQLRLLPAAAQAANAAARTGGLSGNQGTPLSGAGSLSGSYDGSPVRSGVSFDGAYAFDIAAAGGCASPHCQPSSLSGRCSNGSVHNGSCSGAHFEHSFMGNNVGGGHSGHCCVAPQMASPTSTLVGHSASPPPLSPPLSPSGSPPMSPQSPHWSSSPNVHPVSISSFSPGTPSSVSHSQMSFNTSSIQSRVSQDTLGGYSQSPGSPLSRASNVQSGSSPAATAHVHSAERSTPAHRRHLDRLNSMPALSIPPVDISHRSMLQSVSSPLPSPASCSPPSPGGMTTSATMSDLIATIQQMGIRSSAVPLWIQAQAQTLQVANQYSSGPSPLRRCSQSVPSTPTKLRWEERSPRWEMEDNEEVEPPVQRVESGRDLRAKIYGRLGKENRAESGEAPDLGWVNELVKDEQAW